MSTRAVTPGLPSPPPVTGGGEGSAVAGEAVLNDIRDWIRDHLGLQFEADRSLVLASRLNMGFGAHALEAVRARLKAYDEDTIRQVAELASTNHTYFFREPEAYELLATRCCPALKGLESIRMWSAAGSSGEEAYSMALAALGALGWDRRHTLQILGTDISERQLRLAEAATYDTAAVERVPSVFRGHFLETRDGRLRVRHEIRELCHFRRMNLTTMPWPFTQRFHVIFLRNVLYYFDPPTRERIVEACYDAAAPGAWLVVSLSESLLDFRTRWKLVEPGVFRRP